MKMKCVGIQQLDFTSKDGSAIKGTNLFVVYKDEKVTGNRADRLFVNQSVDLPAGVKPGDDLEIFFNMKGKVDAISIIPKG